MPHRETLGKGPGNKIKGLLRVQRDEKFFNFLRELSHENETQSASLLPAYTNLCASPQVYTQTDFVWGSGMLKQTLSGSVMSSGSHVHPRAVPGVLVSPSPPGHWPALVRVTSNMNLTSLNSFWLHYHQTQAGCLHHLVGQFPRPTDWFSHFCCLSKTFSLILSEWSFKKPIWLFENNLRFVLTP